MTFNEIRFLFNRALILTFSGTPLLLAFGVLAMCGMFVIFFNGLSTETSQWLRLSLAFIPVFISAGFLLSAGVLLIRIYHDEVKNKTVDLEKIWKNSWEVVVGATYFSIPILLSYLLLWLILGVFVLMSTIPGIGMFFNTVLIFGPFLINLGTLCLILLNVALLFYVAPILALKGSSRLVVAETLVKRFSYDVFSNIFLLVVGIFPLLCVLGLLVAAMWMTGSLCYDCISPLHTALFWFFLMIPFTALLSPGVVFFFNFAAESHVFMHKLVSQKSMVK